MKPGILFRMADYFRYRIFDGDEVAIDEEN